MLNGISFGGESLSIMDGMIKESLMTMKANNEQAWNEQDYCSCVFLLFDVVYFINKAGKETFWFVINKHYVEVKQE